MQAEAAAPTIAPTPKRTSVAHAWVTDPVFVELASEAQRLRVHPDWLTAQILEVVIAHGLVDAILAYPEAACTK